MAIRIDTSLRPILVVTFEGATTDEGFAAYLRSMREEGPGRRLKSVTILDATRAERPTAQQRRAQATWLADNAEGLRRYSLGTVFVVRSALVKGALTAILWLQPMEGAHAVMSSLDEAMRWAEDRLREAGIEPPTLG